MSKNDPFEKLKAAARDIGRARRIKHVAALELVAQKLGHSHWNAMTAAQKKGWRPSDEDVATVELMALEENPFITLGVDPWMAIGPDKFEGELNGHSYHVSPINDDVRIWGRGWQVVLPEAPLAPARFKVTDKRFKSLPIDDPDFREAILEIASGWRRLIHARIASDWPRRATVPDSDGRAEHPLFGGVSDKWFCMHCDHASTGHEIAANLFHCPKCFATPLDIHPSPWWLGDVGDREEANAGSNR